MAKPDLLIFRSAPVATQPESGISVYERNSANESIVASRPVLTRVRLSRETDCINVHIIDSHVNTQIRLTLEDAQVLIANMQHALDTYLE